MYEPPKWKIDNFLGIQVDKEPQDSAYYRLKREELIGLAYLKHCYDNVHRRGFSYLASFDGRHRSGKSIAAATFGYLWDPTFWKYFESRIVQDYKQFADVMEKISKENIKGAVIMVDEAGVSLSSADWYEKWMKTITKMVQMFGYLTPVVLFVAPVKDFVDSRLRKMFHAYYKMSRYNMDYTTITPYELRFQTVKNKFYYKKPRVRLDYQDIAIRRIILGKPPAKILERYSNLELSRKNIMLEQFLDDVRKAEVKEQKEQVDLDKVVDFVVKNFKAYESDRSKPNDIKLDENLIEFGFKVPNRMAKFIKKKAAQKIQDKYKEVQEHEEKIQTDRKKHLPYAKIVRKEKGSGN